MKPTRAGSFQIKTLTLKPGLTTEHALGRYLELPSGRCALIQQDFKGWLTHGTLLPASNDDVIDPTAHWCVKQFPGPVGQSERPVRVGRRGLLRTEQR